MDTKLLDLTKMLKLYLKNGGIKVIETVQNVTIKSYNSKDDDETFSIDKISYIKVSDPDAINVISGGGYTTNYKFKENEKSTTAEPHKKNLQFINHCYNYYHDTYDNSKIIKITYGEVEYWNENDNIVYDPNQHSPDKIVD